MPAWVAYLIVVGVALASTAVGAFIGVLAGVDWLERRRVRSLQRKRADITRALERDER